MNNPRELQNAYLDGEISAAQAAELAQWLRDDPAHVEELAKLALLHRRLFDHFCVQQMIENMPSQMKIPASSAAPSQQNFVFRNFRRHLRVMMLAGLVAAVLACVITLVLLRPAGPRFARTPSVARIEESAGSSWADATFHPVPGDYVPMGSVTLDAGLVRLSFRNGSSVIVQGPATFEVASDSLFRLHDGELTAMVTPAARGFVVTTSQGSVTDLGTEFGVRSSGGRSEVAVYRGSVKVVAGQSGPQEVLGAGSAAVFSESVIERVAGLSRPLARSTSGQAVSLDLVDLIAGGDGLGREQNIGIDVITGKVSKLSAVGGRQGSGNYIRITGHRVLDGCFTPNDVMSIDSAGDTFPFPRTSNDSFGLIWAGNVIPWTPLPEIKTRVGSIDFAEEPHRLLVLHSNNAITLNLDALRQMHPEIELLGFQAQVGNSYQDSNRSASLRNPKADVFILVDGKSRFERRAFTYHMEPFAAWCDLGPEDHFLTLATTDGGDSSTEDWVLWGDAVFTARRQP